jgi:hypothetical protein
MRMAILVGLAAAPACTLYGGGSGDDGVDAAIVPWDFDAQPVTDAAGVINDCAVPRPCPAASPGRVSVCGQLVDVATDQQLTAAMPWFGVCGSGMEATDGACELAITFYDALDFAGNPTGATPLGVSELILDDCGRFTARDIQRPSLGFLGIGIDDASGAPDDHRLTGVAFPVSSGQVIPRTRAYALTNGTDDAWAAQAGLGASTFVDRGAVLTMFVDADGNAVSGVGVTSNGSQRPGDDYYFSDVDPRTRTTVAPALTSTGPNGCSLMLNSALVEHSGTGGEPTGCSWSSSLAASIAGVLFVQRTELENTTTGAACE